MTTQSTNPRHDDNDAPNPRTCLACHNRDTTINGTTLNCRTCETRYTIPAPLLATYQGARGSRTSHSQRVGRVAS